jgi:hypothetical protein
MLRVHRKKLYSLFGENYVASYVEASFVVLHSDDNAVLQRSAVICFFDRIVRSMMMSSVVVICSVAAWVSVVTTVIVVSIVVSRAFADDNVRIAHVGCAGPRKLTRYPVSTISVGTLIVWLPIPVFAIVVYVQNAH